MPIGTFRTQRYASSPGKKNIFYRLMKRSNIYLLSLLNLNVSPLMFKEVLEE